MDQDQGRVEKTRGIFLATFLGPFSIFFVLFSFNRIVAKSECSEFWTLVKKLLDTCAFHSYAKSWLQVLIFLLEQVREAEGRVKLVNL